MSALVDLPDSQHRSEDISLPEFDSTTEEDTPRLLVLLLLCLGSGCSALIYEIVWFQVLQLAIGSSAVSLGVLLGTFMGGMCLGSLLFPRLVSTDQHPLRVYAFLELGVGAFGLVLLFGIPIVTTTLYSQFGRSGASDLVMRSIICAVCLLPPTVLMGATLPAIARWMKPTPAGISRLGLFYGANIAGAVFGCLLAGFYLLRVFDMKTATYVAVLINVIVGLAAWKLARVSPYRAELAHADGPQTGSDETQPERSGLLKHAASLAILLSGMCALGAEVM